MQLLILDKTIYKFFLQLYIEKGKGKNTESIKKYNFLAQNSAFLRFLISNVEGLKNQIIHFVELQILYLPSRFENFRNKVLFDEISFTLFRVFQETWFLNYRFLCSWKIDVTQPKFDLLSHFLLIESGWIVVIETIFISWDIFATQVVSNTKMRSVSFTSDIEKLDFWWDFPCLFLCKDSSIVCH